jgi:CheY-like chemotaxis protein
MSARILLIEDNATNLELMTYLLRAFGYEVNTANGAAAGLALAESGEYDLVLTDILMPEMDGYEFARRFRAQQRWSATPLVAVTALAMTGDREKIIAHGFDGYIAKPIDPQRFGAEIASFLQKRNDGQHPRR